MPEPPAPHPVRPEVHPHAPARRAGQWPVLAAVAAGGVLGAVARYGLTTAIPHRPGGFAWATFGINVTGCLLIGVLMVLVEEVWTGRRLLRPFLGVGVLGGFTTFSTYTLDASQSVASGAPPAPPLPTSPAPSPRR